MTSLGKKFISAFVEVANGNDQPDTAARNAPSDTPPDSPSDSPLTASGSPPDSPLTASGSPEAARNDAPGSPQSEDRFAQHFDKLLRESNIPGPDYYEFARMIAVMQAIPDEAARYNAAFAGLQVQGLDKQRLLDTAAEYQRILTTDATQFKATVERSYREKVQGKEMEAEATANRIRSLSQEILQLQQQIGALQAEVRSSKDKLAAGSSAYEAGSNRRLEEIRNDIRKINKYIH
jgi:hypothetical protein